MIEYENYWDVKPSPCLSCQQPEARIIRLTNQGRLTRTEMRICQNKKCWKFIDIEKIPTWVIKSSGHYGRDFEIENREDYRPHLTKRIKSKEMFKARNF